MLSASDRLSDKYHAALASRIRRQVLDELAASPVRMDAQSIADAHGLHVSTVRFHLDQLEAAGLVRREADEKKRRGRPRVLYAAATAATTATERDDASREQLIEVLAGALADGEPDLGRRRAVDAGRTWGRAVAADAAANETGEPRDRRETLLAVLDRLGFEPEPEGDTVHLPACPFRDAARAHPQVICSVHSGLVQEIMQDRGETDSARLLPFVQPNRCVIRLA